jgi:citrate lyase subunit beta/citryl-CoA lyase
LVLVRVNNEQTMLYADLYASIHPGLHGIVLPMVETRQEVMELESNVEKLEKERNLAVGRIRFLLIIESPRGLLNAYDIALASHRVESMTIGPEDYCLKLGVEPSNDGIELLYPLSQIVTICKGAGIMPMGLLGSIAGFQDLEAFEGSAARARQLGCVGAACIHPKQVEVLNRVFSPSPEEIKFAQRVVGAFEDGLSKGLGSVNLNGKMVDIPVYKRAKRITLRAKAIEKIERAKREALLQLQ